MYKFVTLLGIRILNPDLASIQIQMNNQSKNLDKPMFKLTH